MLTNNILNTQELALLNKHNLTSIYFMPKSSKIYLTLDQSEVQKNTMITSEDDTYGLTVKMFLIFFLLNGSPKLKLLAHNKSILSLRKRTKTQNKDRFLFLSEISQHSLKGFFLDYHQVIGTSLSVRLQPKLKILTLQKDSAIFDSYQITYLFKELLPAQVRLIKSKLNFDFVNLKSVKTATNISIYTDSIAYLTHTN
jgi:hypothetical protein